MRCIKIIVLLFSGLYIYCNLPTNILDNFDDELAIFSTNKNGAMVNNHSKETIRTHYFYDYFDGKEPDDIYEAMKEDDYGRLYLSLAPMKKRFWLFSKEGQEELWLMFPRKAALGNKIIDFLIQKSNQGVCLFRQERSSKSGILLACIQEKESCYFQFDVYDINQSNNSVSLTCNDKRENKLFYRW